MIAPQSWGKRSRRISSCRFTTRISHQNRLARDACMSIRSSRVTSVGPHRTKESLPGNQPAPHASLRRCDLPCAKYPACQAQSRKAHLCTSGHCPCQNAAHPTPLLPAAHSGGQNNWLINNIKINNLTKQMHREMSSSNPAKNGNFLSKTAIFTSKSPQRYTNFAAAI
jgi:hypothetical protein